MPIAYILGNLLADVPGAVGVTFLDDVGEPIETVTSGLSPEEMRTTGAIAEIQLRRLQRVIAADEESEGGGHLLVEAENLHLHALRLKDGFLLAVLQETPELAGGVARALERAGSDLERELRL